MITENVKTEILITGFGPFLKHKINPSGTVAQALSGGKTYGFRIRGQVLDVSYDACTDFVNSLNKRTEFKAIIMLGLRANRVRIGLERIAINLEDSKHKDQSGKIANSISIDPEGPDGIFSTLPLKKIATELKSHGFNCEISNTAGTYVCNALFYRVMRLCVRSGVPAGFIHLPSVGTKWSQKELVQAVRLAVECVIRAGNKVN